MTATEDNRRLIAGIFAELERGNPVPFRDALAEDVRWTTPGSSVWSRTFEGKPAVLNDLLAMVRAQLVERVQLTVKHIAADGDRVIVEARGRATTKAGEPYNNDYCFIYRIGGGQIVEVIEYLDTELASARLRAPWAPPSATT